jgi:DNA-directed RNA polymerase subunit RPC12/RpoP
MCLQPEEEMTPTLEIPNMMTFEEYKNLDGLNCPKCESTLIYADPVANEGLLVYRENHCTKCGAEWVEYFDVVEIQVIDNV